jgi:hypothetical protein
MEKIKQALVQLHPAALKLTWCRNVKPNGVYYFLLHREGTKSQTKHGLIRRINGQKQYRTTKGAFDTLREAKESIFITTKDYIANHLCRMKNER